MNGVRCMKIDASSRESAEARNDYHAAKSGAVLNATKFLGHSPRMRAVRVQMEKAAAIDLPVLIVGETGSGKEVIAHEIHHRSARGGKPFVALNSGALPRELVASELFGHVKGAFTGATDTHVGRFIEAGQGTLFLDEVGTMDERLQVALLRVLETNAIRPVGSQSDLETKARVIAATNEDLPKLVAQGRFREDLMYRLDVMRIDAPPLREMPEEIPHLAQYFVDQFAQQYDLDVTHVSPEVVNRLLSYPWPGNIRELRNVIAQGCVSASSGEIGIAHLPRRFAQPQDPVEATAVAPAIQNGASNGVGDHVREFDEHRSNGVKPAPSPNPGVYVPLGSTLDEVNRIYVTRTLEYCQNNKTKTAKVLGMSRKILYDRLHRWNSGPTNS